MGESPRTSGGPEDERPISIVLFVDQVAEPFLQATRRDEEGRDEMVTRLIRLAQLGRAAGIARPVSTWSRRRPPHPHRVHPPTPRPRVLASASRQPWRKPSPRISEDGSRWESLLLPPHSPRSRRAQKDQHREAAHGDHGGPGLAHPPAARCACEPKYQCDPGEGDQPPRCA